MAESKTKERPGRKAVTNPDAPHGYEDDGKTPKAPYGYLDNGKPRATKKIDTDIDLDILSQPFTPPPAVQVTASPKHARPERQLAMDAIVASSHKSWVDAGEPKDWAKLPTLMYSVPPDKAEGLRTLIKRGADFQDWRPRFGSPTPCDPETCPTCAIVAQAVLAKAQENLEEITNQANERGVSVDDILAELVGEAVGGHELVVFCIVDKTKREEKEKGEDKEKATK